MNVFEMVARAILLAGADAVIGADKSGGIIFWNAGAERIFGHSAESAVGQSLDLIIPERLRQRHWEGYRRVMKTGNSRYGTGDILAVPGLRKDGSRISLEFTLALLTDEEGQLAGLVAVLRDVTERYEEVRALKRKLLDRTAPSA
jgi:PAS domain S-box-containing protein